MDVIKARVAEYRIESYDVDGQVDMIFSTIQPESWSDQILSVSAISNLRQVRYITGHKIYSHKENKYEVNTRGEEMRETNHGFDYWYFDSVCKPMTPASPGVIVVDDDIVNIYSVISHINDIEITGKTKNGIFELVRSL